MLLQSHQVFDTIADYNPGTDEFVTFSRRCQPMRMTGPITGSFDHINGRRALLFRLAEILYLQIDSQRLSMEDHIVKLRFENGQRLLEVFTGDRVVLKLICTPPTLDPPLELDLTAFIEEEDFDFGLYLANVSSNRDRQARMYKSE